jgi:stage V sporulation protein D (sporulation-specific penicillin-binding protein)
VQLLGKNIRIKKNNRKLILLFIFLFIFVVLLVGRLVKLQILDNVFYAQKAASQQLSVSITQPARGTIYDCNLTPLAESATMWDVTVSPSNIKTDTLRNSIADNLSKILKIDRQTLYNEINNKSGYVVLTKKIEKSVADQIQKYISSKKIGCISLVVDSKRIYPFGNFAAQLIGFTGTDNQGLGGIEAEYDSVLKGTAGSVVTAKNATAGNMPYDIGKNIPAQDGSNLVLTIDEFVQNSLEENLKKALQENHVSNRVTGIVMNVNTGEILGMATEPDFDPNNPFVVSDTTAKQKLSTFTGDALKQATTLALETQWRNKAISDPYEPGSVFKIIVAAGALEEGTVHENDMFFDPGSIKIADKTFPCWLAGGHGAQTFLQGFENSCNVVFIEVGRSLGALNFFKYFSDFGFTQKTGIDLPGEANSIYIHESDLGPVQLASCSFGQSNKLTAIQLITAVAASANGGYLVQPYVVKDETDSSGNVIKSFGTTVKRQVISSATSKEIDNLLEKEVSEGTGKNAYVAGYRIGGKTGTAQKLDASDPNGTVTSFVGVAPCDDPQYAVLFLMDDPHNPVSDFGGVIAAPVVGSIMADILPHLGVQPKYTQAELAKMNIKAPNLKGKSVADVTNLLKSQGLQLTKIGNGETVTSQIPAAGDPLPKNGRIVIYTGDAKAANTISVPDLIGKTPQQVNQVLSDAGLNVDFSGTAINDSTVKAYLQDHTPGSKVTPGTVITVKFRNEKINVQ